MRNKLLDFLKAFTEVALVVLFLIAIALGLLGYAVFLFTP